MKVEKQLETRAQKLSKQFNADAGGSARDPVATVESVLVAALKLGLNVMEGHTLATTKKKSRRSSARA